MRKTEYKLQNPDIVQPRDPSDPLYKLLGEFITDQKKIAIELDVNECVVSDVKRARCRSRRVFDYMITVALKRAKEREKISRYLQTPLTEKAA